MIKRGCWEQKMLPAILINKAVRVKIEKHMFYKQMFSGPCRDNGTEDGLWSLGSAMPSPDVSGDSSLPVTGYLSKLF